MPTLLKRRVVDHVYDENNFPRWRKQCPMSECRNWDIVSGGVILGKAGHTCSACGFSEKKSMIHEAHKYMNKKWDTEGNEEDSW